MKVLALSPTFTLKRTALPLFVLMISVVGTSLESNAQLFWRSKGIANGFHSNSYGTGHTVRTNNYRTPKPVTGYGGNIHRNFVIRQQQQRSQAGGSLLYRGNILWRR